MKSWIIIAAVFLAAGCSVTEKNLTLTNDQEIPDTAAYELVVFEPGFDFWFQSNKLPEWYHSEEYYRHFNTLSANEWNHRYISFGFRKPYDFYIDYDPKEDYGPELEYKLYYFFRFMEDKYNMSLIAQN